MGYAAVLFDLDGTLLDTLADLRTACNVALRSVGERERSLEDVRRFVGNGIARLMELAIPGGRGHPRFAEALATLQAFYAAHNRVETRPYAGVEGLMRELKAAGRKLAVVSNKPDAAVRALCGELFAGLPDVAIGERAGVRRKPAPDMVLEALRALGTGAGSAVYVGDSEVDLATARNAGLPCISVTWGFRSRAELLAAGATTLADTAADVARMVIGG